MRFALSILLVGLFAGCIPYPHTSERSREVRGRVLDARSHAPIEGARIFLTDHPATMCTTDATGSFRLKATHNFHFGVIPPEGDWPEQKYYWNKVTILYTNYVPRELDNFVTDVGDILLERRP